MSHNAQGNGLPAIGDLRNRVGQVRLEKGSWNTNGVNDFYLVAWDFAVPCEYEKCVVYDRCTYVRKWTMKEGKEGLGKAGRTDKCVMQMRYIRNVMFAFARKMKKDKRNEHEDVIKFGFSLIPLYAQLFKFKLYEFGNNDVMVYSARGDSKINPVYKEIREIIKTIHGVWRDIGSGIKMEKSPSEIGDDAFLDALYCVNDNPKNNDDNNITVSDEKGSGIDFDGDQYDKNEDEISEDGIPVDEIEQYNTLFDTNKRKQTPKVLKKSTKRKRKRKKEPKITVRVLSPLQRAGLRDVGERPNTEVRK